MANLNITNIPAPRVPFIDERTGLMAREWYRFFLNLFVLTGSGNNPITLEELQLGPPNQPDLTELLIQINQNIAPQYEDQSGDFLATLDTAQLMSMMSRFENAEAAIQGAYLQPVVQTGTIANYNLDGSPTAGGVAYGTGPALAVSAAGTVGQVLTSAGAGTPTWATPTTGTVTSVSFTGGIITVATATTTPALTVAGTSGGIPYFSSGSTWASSAALAAGAIVLGGGAGVTPATTTTGTGVVTALGVNTGTAGAFVVNGGALGTPSSGTATNLTGTASININGTVGATTANTGAFTTGTFSSTLGVTGTSTLAAVNTSGNVTVAVSGMTSSVKIGPNAGAPTYGLISFNGIMLDDGTGMNIGGGGGVDTSMYFNVATAGTYVMRVANTAALTLTATSTTLSGTLGVSGTSTLAAVNASGLVTATVAGNALVAYNSATASASGSMAAQFRGLISAEVVGHGPYVEFTSNGSNNLGRIWAQYQTSNNVDLIFQVYNSGTPLEALRLSNVGIVTMPAYGAGAATFSAAGVISSVSDERLKIKDGVIADPIPMLMALEPGYYFGKPEANMGPDRQLGFYAQNVRAAIGPEAAPDPQGDKPWGYFDRSVLAVVVESAKSHEAQIQELLARIATLEARWLKS